MTDSENALYRKPRTADDGLKAKHYADVERAKAGAESTEKGQALSRKQRDEDGERAKRFAEIERRGEG